MLADFIFFFFNSTFQRLAAEKNPILLNIEREDFTHDAVTNSDFTLEQVKFQARKCAYCSSYTTSTVFPPRAKTNVNSMCKHPHSFPFIYFFFASYWKALMTENLCKVTLTSLLWITVACCLRWIKYSNRPHSVSCLLVHHAQPGTKLSISNKANNLLNSHINNGHHDIAIITV